MTSTEYDKSYFYRCESTRPSVQKIIARSTKIDKLYLGKYVPMREKKLLDRLLLTRSVFEDAIKYEIENPSPRKHRKVALKPCLCDFSNCQFFNEPGGKCTHLESRLSKSFIVKKSTKKLGKRMKTSKKSNEENLNRVERESMTKHLLDDTGSEDIKNMERKANKLPEKRHGRKADRKSPNSKDDSKEIKLDEKYYDGSEGLFVASPEKLIEKKLDEKHYVHAPQRASKSPKRRRAKETRAERHYGPQSIPNKEEEKHYSFYKDMTKPPRTNLETTTKVEENHYYYGIKGVSKSPPVNPETVTKVKENNFHYGLEGSQEPTIVKRKMSTKVKGIKAIKNKNQANLTSKSMIELSQISSLGKLKTKFSRKKAQNTNQKSIMIPHQSVGSTKVTEMESKRHHKQNHSGKARIHMKEAQATHKRCFCTLKLKGEDVIKSSSKESVISTIGKHKLAKRKHNLDLKKIKTNQDLPRCFCFQKIKAKPKKKMRTKESLTTFEILEPSLHQNKGSITKLRGKVNKLESSPPYECDPKNCATKEKCGYQERLKLSKKCQDILVKRKVNQLESSEQYDCDPKICITKDKCEPLENMELAKMSQHVQRNKTRKARSTSSLKPRKTTKPKRTQSANHRKTMLTQTGEFTNDKSENTDTSLITFPKTPNKNSTNSSTTENTKHRSKIKLSREKTRSRHKRGSEGDARTTATHTKKRTNFGLKRCYCTLKIHKAVKDKRKLGHHILNPSTSNKCTGTSCKSQSILNTSHKGKNIIKRNEDVSHVTSCRQAVKITSSFDFYVEFSKENLPKELRDKYSSHNVSSNHRESEISPTFKTAKVTPRLKRCFCTLQLQEELERQRGGIKHFTVRRVAIEESDWHLNRHKDFIELKHLKQSKKIDNLQDHTTPFQNENMFNVSCSSLTHSIHNNRRTVRENNSRTYFQILRSHSDSNLQLNNKNHINKNRDKMIDEIILKIKDSSCSRSVPVCCSCLNLIEDLCNDNRNVKIKYPSFYLTLCNNVNSDSPFARTFFAMNLSEKQDKFVARECPPGICIPNECDPYKCLSIIKKLTEAGEIKTKKRADASTKSTVGKKPVMKSKSDSEAVKEKTIGTERHKPHKRHKKSQTGMNVKKKESRMTNLKRCFCTLQFQKKTKEQDNDVGKRNKNGNENKNMKVHECEPNICIPGKCKPEECFQRIKTRFKKINHTASSMSTKTNLSQAGVKITKKGKKIQTKSEKNNNERKTKSIEKSRNAKTKGDQRKVKKHTQEVTMKQNVSQKIIENKTGVCDCLMHYQPNENSECEESCLHRQAVKVGSSLSFSIEFYRDSPELIQAAATAVKHEGTEVDPGMRNPQKYEQLQAAASKVKQIKKQPIERKTVTEKKGTTTVTHKEISKKVQKPKVKKSKAKVQTKKTKIKKDDIMHSKASMSSQRRVHGKVLQNRGTYADLHETRTQPTIADKIDCKHYTKQGVKIGSKFNFCVEFSKYKLPTEMNNMPMTTENTNKCYKKHFCTQYLHKVVPVFRMINESINVCRQEENPIQTVTQEPQLQNRKFQQPKHTTKQDSELRSPAVTLLIKKLYSTLRNHVSDNKLNSEKTLNKGDVIVIFPPKNIKKSKNKHGAQECKNDPHVKPKKYKHNKNETSIHELNSKINITNKLNMRYVLSQDTRLMRPKTVSKVQRCLCMLRLPKTTKKYFSVTPCATMYQAHCSKNWKIAAHSVIQRVCNKTENSSEANNGLPFRCECQYCECNLITNRDHWNDFQKLPVKHTRELTSRPASTSMTCECIYVHPSIGPKNKSYVLVNQMNKCFQSRGNNNRQNLKAASICSFANQKSKQIQTCTLLNKNILAIKTDHRCTQTNRSREKQRLHFLKPETNYSDINRIINYQREMEKTKNKIHKLIYNRITKNHELQQSVKNHNKNMIMQICSKGIELQNKNLNDVGKNVSKACNVIDRRAGDTDQIHHKYSNKIAASYKLIYNNSYTFNRAENKTFTIARVAVENKYLWFNIRQQLNSIITPKRIQSEHKQITFSPSIQNNYDKIVKKYPYTDTPKTFDKVKIISYVKPVKESVHSYSKLETITNENVQNVLAMRKREGTFNFGKRYKKLNSALANFKNFLHRVIHFFHKMSPKKVIVENPNQ